MRYVPFASGYESVDVDVDVDVNVNEFIADRRWNLVDSRHKNLLRKRAAAAACTLLGISSAAQAAEKVESADRWTMDTSFMRYSEAERITVLEPQVGVRRDFSGDRSLNVLVTVDTISGATPLGTLPATANTAPNTVTNASGKYVDSIVGKMPLSHMTDTRVAIETSWQQPLSSVSTGLVGVNVSKEKDYVSAGANAKWSRDFNQKNTTLSFGVAPEFDSSNPNGGLPVAYSVSESSGSINGTHDSKILMSGVAGITQVISRRTVMQLNYGLTYENGYLNDPYKLISIANNGGDPLSAIHEKRPGDRLEHSLYWLTKHNIWANDVVSLGLRFYQDDWGIHSQTLDFKFRRQSNERFYWEPHVRYYHQSQADFFHFGLLNTQPLPEFASADLRLAEFSGVTFGVQFGLMLQNGSELTLRAEYYTQNGDSQPASAIGAQRNFDLFPTLNAGILQVDYTFDPAKLWPRKK